MGEGGGDRPRKKKLNHTPDRKHYWQKHIRCRLFMRYKLSVSSHGSPRHQRCPRHTALESPTEDNLAAEFFFRHVSAVNSTKIILLRSHHARRFSTMARDVPFPARSGGRGKSLGKDAATPAPSSRPEDIITATVKQRPGRRRKKPGWRRTTPSAGCVKRTLPKGHRHACRTASRAR